MRKSSLLLITALCIIAVLGSQQNALSIPRTFNFEGTVTTVPDQISATFNTTQTITGSYTFESSQPDSDPAVNKGFYTDGITALNINIDGYTATLHPLANDNYFDIEDMGFLNKDRYTLNVDPLANIVNGFNSSFFSLNLTDDDANAITGDALPDVPPDLSDFTSARWYISFENADPDIFEFIYLRGDLISLTLADISTVPEPSTLLLFGTGLVGIGIFRRKFKG